VVGLRLLYYHSTGSELSKTVSGLSVGLSVGEKTGGQNGSKVQQKCKNAIFDSPEM